MASLIPGYEYDIFISYRQKDNKYDGWVTEFVDNLKRELEATFKEEISVYFDIDPQDGLLETHDVDKSLEGKLKSLIFIPIISQTYCDPKSFAWQYEFCAFNKLAGEDQFGRDLKLRSGNVSSRILPIKINDLDPEDNELFEKELGGFLRAIEFIYKEAGVNRPLTSDDDPKTNLNKTRYRNQINKVALTVKEIIISLKNFGKFDKKPTEQESVNSVVSLRKIFNKKIIFLSVLIVLASFIGIILTFNFFAQKTRKDKIYSEIIPEIKKLQNEAAEEGFISDKYWKAALLIFRAENELSRDTNLVLLKSSITKTISILTEPAGADIYGKQYSDSDTSWFYFGKTPLYNAYIPRGASCLKIVKSGYKVKFDAFNVSDESSYDTLFYKLLTEDEPVGNMTLIAGQHIKPSLNGISDLESQWVGDFLVDIHEVTNIEYMEFLENGGYRNPKFWIQQFLKEGKQLSWQEAMSFFTDQTGNYGPAGWSNGIYPTGEAYNPVSGISWYEAAAYAEFSSKSLPTIYHWSILFDRYLIPTEVKYSNIVNGLIAPVGTFKGISRYGLYDYIGNVREWIYNKNNKNNFIFGGGARDPEYYAVQANSADPWHRDNLNGFRCIKYVNDSVKIKLEEAVNFQQIDRSKDKPISDREFRLVTRMFEYNRTPIETKKETIEKLLSWEHKTITIASAYEGPDLEIHIYLPNNISPPFQSIILFPGINARNEPSLNINNYPLYYEFLLRSGRAIVLPKYYNTYGRGRNFGPPSNLSEFLEANVKRVKDLQRTIDYLEFSTNVFDTSKIAYFGLSWGSSHAPFILAIEKRIKLGILQAFGLNGSIDVPELYHVNYLPRVTVPMLLLSGKYDYDWSFEEQNMFFELLGTRNEDKRWVLHESVHGVPIIVSQKELINWLDKYFGPVVNQ